MVDPDTAKSRLSFKERQSTQIKHNVKEKYMFPCGDNVSSS